MSTLDELLAEWAASQRLTAGEAAAVRTAIVGEPQGLPAIWWGDFHERMSQIMVRTAAATVR